MNISPKRKKTCISLTQVFVFSSSSLSIFVYVFFSITSSPFLFGSSILLPKLPPFFLFLICSPSFLLFASLPYFPLLCSLARSYCHLLLPV
ncbi:hypothetical protein CSUI_008510 [Cystoisospora suis]|uniref:Transmembrane protein n=1 Tax=Cystoisospora suis TaxID=483139 RepID=A0A2C6KJD4_9APIC|nr:hypothetical protein CSUI_008510 [Cystoisospora suis]